MNSYELSRNFFDWCFENPDKVNVNHVAIYFFAIEHCNRLGWKTKFGFPSQMTMEALGIKSYNTYIKAFNDLVEFGFIYLVEKSKNQYSANIIALSNFNNATNKALDKAFIKHTTKQSESTQQSTSESNYSINKQITIEPFNQKQLNKEQESKKVFIKPTLIECENIFIQKTAFNWTEWFAKSEAAIFFNFYESKDWMVGKNKMKNLNGAIGGWVARTNKSENTKSKSNTTNSLIENSNKIRPIF